MPPSDSTRNIDPGEFYDTLLFQIHNYCKDDFSYLCGDFDSRCGDLEDFIAGVDSIPDRNVIDYTINKEGERFCETGRGSSIGSEFAWHASGPEFDPTVRPILSWRLGHENISTAILPLPLIQEEQLSVTGEKMCTKYW